MIKCRAVFATDIVNSSIHAEYRKSSIFISVSIFKVYLYAYYQAWPYIKCTFVLLYTALNLKACTINNASGASAVSRKVRAVPKGRGSPEERPYDVSRGQNRYVTLLLV